jgi:hypothetical protein
MLLNRSKGTPLKTTVTVTYKITGTAKLASITMTDATGGIEQSTHNLPFTYDMEVQHGAMLSLLAQNQGDKGTVKCEIVTNGEVVKTSTSEGAYVIATCTDWVLK